MKLTVVLAVLIGIHVLACSTAAPSPAEPTPNIDATVEAKLEKAVDATVEARLNEAKAFQPTATPYSTYTQAPSSTQTVLAKPTYSALQTYTPNPTYTPLPPPPTHTPIPPSDYVSLIVDDDIEDIDTGISVDGWNVPTELIVNNRHELRDINVTLESTQLDKEGYIVSREGWTFGCIEAGDTYRLIRQGLTYTNWEILRAHWCEREHLSIDDSILRSLKIVSEYSKFASSY